MARRLIAIAAALCLASASAAALDPASARAAEPGPAVDLAAGQSAKIRRTENGVPHIVARDYGGLGYGYGYAFAQDDLCQLADHVVTLRGERSRYFGPAASSVDAPGTTNLASDAYYKGVLDPGTVQRLLDRPAPLGPTDELRRMVEGYADGYNRYLRDTGTDRLPDPTCRGQAWVGPITPVDLWGVLLDLNTIAGTAAVKQDIGTATPPTATPAAVTPTATPPAAAPPAPRLARPADAETGPGSNGWALGRDATRDGDPLLLANPHLGWTGSTRFYQVHLTIPGVLDVAGAGLYGVPVVQIGHTRTLAWTHTASYSQHASVYRVTLVPGDPTSYLVDGRPEAMTRRTVPVTVRAADGTLSTVERTVYGTRYGPVAAGGWTTAHAYAVRDANADNLRSADEWLAMGRAQTLGELQQAQRTFQGMPWVYTMAVDTGGAAYFTDSSAVPHLTDAQLARCALTGTDVPDALDGSTIACDWGSDPDARVPGLYGPSHQPALTRTDYVANSNNGPYLVNPQAPLPGLPTVYNPQPRLGTRPQLGLTMIADRRDGSDGLGAPGFTLATLQDTVFGNRVYTAELDRDDTVAMCRAHPVLPATDGTPVDVRAACDALARWDTRADTGSRGTVLWQTFHQALGRSGPPAWQKVPYDPAAPLTTPRGIDGEHPAAQHALADAVRTLAARGTAPDAPIGQVQRWAGIPLHGCSGAEGCFNVLTASPGSGRDGGTQPADLTGLAFGSSFVMATELTDRGPRTRTLLTYGQSVNPRSPHYTDQTVRYARKQWITERFTPAEIAAAPGLTVTALAR
ncbi:penicillin acylase family protein [Kitasatospora sp. NPDC086801]|uniref:penicillin acylase family protein n=1 Tax=Kitasatospora sp. NPDC086801 TaxID=3364066 RepID=UPI00381255E3